ncbi:hypothetical protein TgHK011_003755 [Trichoderma gracile]|nr:hypothetical protein TgHK011_003755 [Trichoderma gracile]
MQLRLKPNQAQVAPQIFIPSARVAAQPASLPDQPHLRTNCSCRGANSITPFRVLDYPSAGRARAIHLFVLAAAAAAAAAPLRSTLCQKHGVVPSRSRSHRPTRCRTSLPRHLTSQAPTALRALLLLPVKPCPLSACLLSLDRSISADNLSTTAGSPILPLGRGAALRHHPHTPPSDSQYRGRSCFRSLTGHHLPSRASQHAHHIPKTE